MKLPVYFYVVSIFPDVVRSYVNESILGRAQKNGIINVTFYNPRDFVKVKKDRSKNNRPYRAVDDRPYGGGPGMVMKAEPILAAVAAIRKKIGRKKSRIIIFSPHGRNLSSPAARNFAVRGTHLILIAGHYEGIDARVKKILRAEEISIGPYVLTGGEVPAMALIDAVARFIPGVLGKRQSLEEERIASRNVYTRPPVLLHRGRRYKVPGVLLSGNHRAIDAWRSKTHKTTIRPMGDSMRRSKKR